MYYYYVWIRSNRYHGKDPLTYWSDVKLEQGAVVQVELQKVLVLGVVSAATTKPRFQTKKIEYIYAINELPNHLLRLASWLRDYYPAPLGLITQQILPSKLDDKYINTTNLEELDTPNTSKLPSLTIEQNQALQNMTSRNTYILHGVTGSGKTRLYIELALLQINSGKSVIVLTPEISLVTQLADNFKEVFGARVIVVHSHMTHVERQKVWLLCLKSKDPLIIIGPRSALFSPVSKIGLIIMDESHENAYKQDQAPQYQTGRVASYLANIVRASLVLGSATPSISDYYLAKQKNKPIIRLKKLATSALHDAPKISIIDKKDMSLFSRSPLISNQLIDAITNALSRQEQSLLYLNRRGTARLVLCENCGWQAMCPHCDIPLTYHGDYHELRCHSCTYHSGIPSQCPICAHPQIIFKTAGTKAIVDDVKRLFPQARIARFDTDNAKADRFEQHFSSVKKGDIDIIIGTQLLAKGLDLPRLSTLGILLADTSLYLPDFSAQERTYQLISQVLGRIGRGHIAGRAIIQTFQPDHPVILDAINSDYEAFFNKELGERKLYNFPPFCYLLKVSVRRATLESAVQAAQSIKEGIRQLGARVSVEGPAPAFHERFQNKFQWQLVVKARDRNELVKIIDSLPANCSYDIDPLDLM